MQSESLMLYKLIILYILDRMDFPITNTELTRFILEKEYCDYITINQILEELIEEKTGINTMTAEDPMTAVAIGTGKYVEFIADRKDKR